MKVTIPIEARDSVGRALIGAQSSELDKLRTRVTELERGFAQVKRELAGFQRGESAEPWE